MMIDENVEPQRASGEAKSQKGSKQKGRTIEQMYQKKTQLEHILLRPDTYIGSVEKQTQQMWVLDTESKEMVNRPCTFVSYSIQLWSLSNDIKGAWSLQDF
jgi:DNA topoisomerase II